MIRSRTAQLVYQTIYCTLGFVGCVACLGIVKFVRSVRLLLYLAFTIIKMYAKPDLQRRSNKWIFLE